MKPYSDYLIKFINKKELKNENYYISSQNNNFETYRCNIF